MHASIAESAPIIVPHGIEQIIATFGDIFAYLHSDYTLDPSWEREQLTSISLPFPLTLSWDRSCRVTRMRCHRQLQNVFERCFQQIASENLAPELTSFGGCFSFRPQRKGTKLSTHSWGIAIDLNPGDNKQGTAGTMDPRIVAIFCRAGFTWGGDWKGKSQDPMHFQFCSGY